MSDGGNEAYLIWDDTIGPYEVGDLFFNGVIWFYLFSIVL